jgi:hypothetical protein
MPHSAQSKASGMLEAWPTGQSDRPIENRISHPVWRTARNFCRSTSDFQNQILVWIYPWIRVKSFSHPFAIHIMMAAKPWMKTMVWYIQVPLHWQFAGPEIAERRSIRAPNRRFAIPEGIRGGNQAIFRQKVRLSETNVLFSGASQDLPTLGRSAAHFSEHKAFESPKPDRWAHDVIEMPRGNLTKASETNLNSANIHALSTIDLNKARDSIFCPEKVGKTIYPLKRVSLGRQVIYQRQTVQGKLGITHSPWIFDTIRSSMAESLSSPSTN